MKWGFVRLPLTIIAMFVGVRFGGIVGVAWGMISVEVLSLAIVLHVFKVLGRSSDEYWRALFPAIIGSTIMAVFLAIASRTLTVNHLQPLMRILLIASLGCMAYVAVIAIGFKKSSRDFIGLIKVTVTDRARRSV